MRPEDVKREDVKREGRGERCASFTFHVPRSTRAFTLLEMIVVLALLAVLTAVVTMSLAGPRRAARAQDAADEILNYDRSAREWCRRFGQAGGITFDLDRGTVRRAMAGERDGSPQPAAMHLPVGFRVARLVSAGKSQVAGEVTLPCSARGQTPSYALLLAAPEGRQQWVVVAGLTGKAVTAGDAREVEAIFQSLSGGDDAP